MAKRKEKSFEQIAADPIVQGKLMASQAWSDLYQVAPPVVTYLLPMLFDMPSVVSREDMSRRVGIPLSARTLANLDSLDKGPRLRFKDPESGRIVYPAAFVLEWLEERGFQPLIARVV